MELSKEFMLELVATRAYSDFTFKVAGCDDHKVHKLILAAKSPVFRNFFMVHEKEADLFDLFRCEDFDELEDANEHNKLAVRDAMTDIFAYCYLDTYSPRSRNLSGDFSDSVLSHLLTYTLAHGFDLHGLVELVERCFRAAFAFYCANAADSRVIAALQKCFSPKFTRHPAPALQLLHETALRAFETRLAMHKRNGQFREALALMEAVPRATAEVYSRPLDCEGELQNGKDSDESAGAD